MSTTASDHSSTEGGSRWGTRAQAQPAQLLCGPSDNTVLKVQFSSLPPLPFSLNPKEGFSGRQNSEDSEAWPCWPGTSAERTVSAPFILSYSKERRPEAPGQQHIRGCLPAGKSTCSVPSDQAALLCVRYSQEEFCSSQRKKTVRAFVSKAIT